MMNLLRKHYKLIIATGALVCSAAAVLIVWLWINVDSFDLADMIFYFIAAVTLGCATFAIMSRNIVRSVFSLLGTFFGMAGLYAMLAADFVAVVQLMVYVGGILVLMLFAVMFTSNIEKAYKSSRSSGLMGWMGAGILGLVVFAILGSLAVLAPWKQVPPGPYTPSTSSIGGELLSSALLPFELLSVVLLAIVIGSVVIARIPTDSEIATRDIKKNEEASS